MEKLIKLFFISYIAEPVTAFILFFYLLRLVKLLILQKREILWI